MQFFLVTRTLLFFSTLRIVVNVLNVFSVLHHRGVDGVFPVALFAAHLFMEGVGRRVVRAFQSGCLCVCVCHMSHCLRIICHIVCLSFITI